MPERSPAQRTVSIHETDRNFYVVADPPFRGSEEGYGWLDFMAVDVRRLKRSRTQVFIYPKASFGSHHESQQSGIQEYVEEIAEHIGATTVPHAIHKINVEAVNGKR